MSDNSPIQFTFSGGQRIANAVRKLEGTPPPNARAPVGTTPATTFLAQIVAEDSSNHGWYSFTKQTVQGGSIVADPSGFTTTAITPPCVAQEINLTTGIAAGTNVEMQFAGYNASNNSIYTFAYGGTGDESGMLVVVGANTSNQGIYNGNFSAGSPSINSTSGAITGMNLGSGCIVVNGPEVTAQRSSGALYIKGNPVVPGVIKGIDVVTGYPVVWVSVTSIGCEASSS